MRADVFLDCSAAFDILEPAQGRKYAKVVIVPLAAAWAKPVWRALQPLSSVAASPLATAACCNHG